MRVSDFDYELPPERIAQRAVEPRDHSRLMVLSRADGSIQHRHFYDLPEFLEATDVLLLNDTRVMPYRIRGRRATGGAVEGLLMERTTPDTWRAMLTSRGRLKPGERLSLLDGRLEAELLGRDDDFIWRLRLPTPGAEALLSEFGLAPLPPYIRRDPNDAELARYDRQRYQTTFARTPGAIAAPTAGMHFTPELLGRIVAKGIEVVTATLHVGLGTFQPVRVDEVSQHRMHAERYEITPEAAESLARALVEHRRIVAVGTTSVRVLEHGMQTGGLRPGAGETRLFITPSFAFRAVGALVTNFHLPRSTLLMLVSAFAGTQRILDAYRRAISKGYRFTSYGDAMLIV